MATQPDTAVADASTPVETPAVQETTVDDLYQDDQPQEGGDPDRAAGGDEPEAQGEGEPDPNVSDEADEADDANKADEPEQPAIAPPVSWKADAKDAFAKLPAELQRVVADRETERERFVQSKAQEAAQVRTALERQAMEEVAELRRQTAERLSQYAEAEPQRPDPRLLNEDPQAFYEAQAAFEAQSAQRVQAQRDAQQATEEASYYQQEIERREAAEQITTLREQFPEYLDPATAPKLQQDLGSIGAALGYSSEQMAQARAVDIMGLRTASDWKAKADKYDQLMKNKMEPVRAAKKLPPVTRPGVSGQPQQLPADDLAALYPNDIRK